jgi:hypothetical protein
VDASGVVVVSEVLQALIAHAMTETTHSRCIPPPSACAWQARED